MKAVEGMTLEKLQVIIEAQTKAYYEELKKVQQQTKSATSAVEAQTNKIKNAFSKIGKAVGPGSFRNCNHQLWEELH